MHFLDIPISTVPRPRYNGHTDSTPATNGSTITEMEPQGYLRVPVWVIVLLITIAGGLILNGAATVYWAATFKQSFQDFKEETYKQKIEQLDAHITRLETLLTKEADQRKADVDLLTERENDTRNRMAGKGLFR